MPLRAQHSGGSRPCCRWRRIDRCHRNARVRLDGAELHALDSRHRRRRNRKRQRCVAHRRERRRSAQRRRDHCRASGIGDTGRRDRRATRSGTCSRANPVSRTRADPDAQAVARTGAVASACSESGSRSVTAAVTRPVACAITGSESCSVVHLSDQPRQRVVQQARRYRNDLGCGTRRLQVDGAIVGRLDSRHIRCDRQRLRNRQLYRGCEFLCQRPQRRHQHRQHQLSNPAERVAE